MTKLSIVVPTYNEEKNIKIFIERIVSTVQKITEKYEIIFALDPSEDDSEKLILEEIKNNNKIRMISFSRRFGQPSATMAALKYSKGVIILSINRFSRSYHANLRPGDVITEINGIKINKVSNITKVLNNYDNWTINFLRGEREYRLTIK